MNINNVNLEQFKKYTDTVNNKNTALEIKNEFIKNVIPNLFINDEDGNPMSIQAINHNDEKIIFKFLNPIVDNVKIKATDVLIFNEINQEVVKNIFSEEKMRLILEENKKEEKDILLTQIISSTFKDIIFLKKNGEKRSESAIDNSLNVISKFLQIKKYNEDERTFDNEWTSITKENLKSFTEENNDVYVLIAFFFISYFMVNIQ
jgi:hypothetical protein